MTSPHTDIESALAYASHDKEGLVISSQYRLDQKNEHFEKLLSEVRSIDDLLVLQERLETDLPWFKLASDESVKDYFSRWNVHIENHSDLELFAAALSQRIADLAVSDSTAQKYQEEKKYRLQLRNLPAALSQFKQTQQSFDSLAEPLDALLRYVYQAVTEQDFSMDEDGATATQIYSGRIELSLCRENKKVVGLCLDSGRDFENQPDFNKTTFFVYPIYQEREVTTEGHTWYGRKKTVTETEITDQIERMIIRPMDVLDHYLPTSICKSARTKMYRFEPPTKKISNSPVGKVTCWCYYHFGYHELNIPSLTAQEFLQTARTCALETPDTHLQPFRTLLQTLFNLPKYMHNYTVKLNQEMKDIIDNIPNGE
ncbi:MAG: hypothetical protein AABW48_00955 [Nanoarchaeota archaeon]